jgi:hypothetical protein
MNTTDVQANEAPDRATPGKRRDQTETRIGATIARVNATKANTPVLVAAAQDVLLQGLSLLFQLRDRQFAQIARAPFHASIGGHFRHVLEHFHCLIEGLPAGQVNYDARRRNPRIENEVSFASIATCDVLRTIKRWSPETLDRNCKTLSSEAYVAHAIHHYAIIRLLCQEAGVEVPSEFGYAPSTLKHQSSRASD